MLSVFFIYLTTLSLHQIAYLQFVVNLSCMNWKECWRKWSRHIFRYCTSSF